MKNHSFKTFICMFAGSLLGGILLLSATYSTYPRDPAFYLSYADYLLIIFLISCIMSTVFWSFYHFFKVSNKNLFVIGLTALITQAVIYVAPFVISIDLGVLGFAAALVMFPAIANFLLDKIGKRGVA